MLRPFRWMIAGLCACTFAASLMTGCTPRPAAEKPARPTVVVTVGPQAAFVREVAGDRMNIVTVLPPGANHETYSVPPQEMERISSAGLYLTLGLPPERNGLLPKVSEMNRGLKIIDVPAEVARSYPPRFFAPDDPDPHIWLSPKRAGVMVRITARELSLLDPANAASYEANARRFEAEIARVDRELREMFHNRDKRTFIVYHPAFGYFADDYGLEMVALEEEGKEADPGRVREIIDLARSKDIRIIFYQEDIDGRLSRTLAEELGGRAEKVSPMADDYVQNLKRMGQAFEAGMK